MSGAQCAVLISANTPWVTPLLDNLRRCVRLYDSYSKMFLRGEDVLRSHNQTTSNNTDDDTTSIDIPEHTKKQIPQPSLCCKNFFSFRHKIINKFSSAVANTGWRYVIYRRFLHRPWLPTRVLLPIAQSATALLWANSRFKFSIVVDEVRLHTYCTDCVCVFVCVCVCVCVCLCSLEALNDVYGCCSPLPVPWLIILIDGYINDIIRVWTTIPWVKRFSL